MCERATDEGDIQASWWLWRSCGEVGVRKGRCCCCFDGGGGVVVISKSRLGRRTEFGAWMTRLQKTSEPHVPI